MELILVGVICWLWFRLRAAHAASAREAARQSSVSAFASVVVCEVEGNLYWLRHGQLVRSPVTSGLAEIENAVPVDPLTVDDVDPATVIEILDALEALQSGQLGSIH